MGYMLDQIGEPAMYEQLAEECTELAKAALKMARIIRNENPTPVTATEASDMIIEEAADVLICLEEVGAFDSSEVSRIAHAKRERFKARWEEAHSASKS